MKYNYEKVLEDAYDYVASFRDNNYYSGNDDIEVIDLLKAKDHLDGFCIGNVVKYVTRAGLKSTDSRRSDLMKCFHYLIILMVLENPERYGEKNNANEQGADRSAEKFFDH